MRHLKSLCFIAFLSISCSKKNISTSQTDKNGYNAQLAKQLGADDYGMHRYVETVEEAEALTNTDPAIKAGSLVMELLPWYGSAALMKVNDIHGQIAKINI